MTADDQCRRRGAAIALSAPCWARPSPSGCSGCGGGDSAIREDGPHTHMEKMGTPTMGGLVILTAMGARTWSPADVQPVHRRRVARTGRHGGPRPSGFVDDFIKVRRQRSLGPGEGDEVLGQGGLSSPSSFAWGLVRCLELPPSYRSSGRRGSTLGSFFYAWVFIIFAATTNAVNLTDGLGRAGFRAVAMVMAAYVIIAFWQFRHTCAALPVPSCYEVDVRTSLTWPSWPRGGSVPSPASCGGTPPRPGCSWATPDPWPWAGWSEPWPSPPTRSCCWSSWAGCSSWRRPRSCSRCSSFRVFGRRLFRMAPIHHHFEVLGWPEFTVIVRFWIVAGLAVLFGLGLFYADFLARGGRE